MLFIFLQFLLSRCSGYFALKKHLGMIYNTHNNVQLIEGNGLKLDSCGLESEHLPALGW
jgi:hypothetical protein